MFKCMQGLHMHACHPAKPHLYKQTNTCTLVLQARWLVGCTFACEALLKIDAMLLNVPYPDVLQVVNPTHAGFTAAEARVPGL